MAEECLRGRKMFRAKKDVWLRRIQIMRSGKTDGVKSLMWAVIKVGGMMRVG